MSCNGWEAGTLVLPSAAVAPLKKALREYSNKMFTDVLAEAKKIKAAAKTSSPAKLRKYLIELREAEGRVAAQRSTGWGYREPSAASVYQKSVVRSARHLLYCMTEAPTWNAPAPTRVGVPTVADMGRIGLKKFTNKDNEFPVITVDGSVEGSVVFKDRTVTWSVDENNHAVDNARQAPLAKVFFTELDKVKWTRGTGGQIVGNDEYNRDNKYDGGGANYVTASYGPVGDDAQIAAYVRSGWSRKVATDMVKKPKSSASSYATRW